MASRLKLTSALVATLAFVSACANPFSHSISLTAAQGEPTAANAYEPDRLPSRCSRDGPSASLETYKIGVARHILRSNLGYTFDGHLPPMLPAIVVLRLSVDPAGTLTDVFIQRSRDAAAAEAAMASIRRSGTFPLPCGLIVRSNGTLTFSETFLFNGNYQFQLRSLADPQ